MAKFINLDKPRFDQETYYGRLLHFMEITSPRNLLISDDQLERYKEMIASYRRMSKDPHVNVEEMKLKFPSEQELWAAKTALDATLHPDTGEKIPLPFRMSSFVPTNLIVTAGLLIPGASQSTMLFWQWANQSVNVAFNYFNANKSGAEATSSSDSNGNGGDTETAVAYFAAVSTSMATALGLRRLAHGRGSVASSMVPFASVALANIVNVFTMRWREIRDGIPVYGGDDGDEQVKLGNSKIAAQTALTQVAISRIVIAFPALLVPPLCLTALTNRFPRLGASKLGTMGVNLALITGSLMTALPCAIALFPQRGSLQIDSIEPELREKYLQHSIKNESNGATTSKKMVYFNKGL